jgi:phosphoglycerate kinase
MGREMPKQTINEIDVRGKRVLMRVDFNVPRDDYGVITDDRRIVQALPAIHSVIDRGGKLILMSHLGRPDGTGYEPALSLEPVANDLAQLLPGTTVTYAGESCISPAVTAAIEAMHSGDVVVLENLRFHAGEKAGDEAFAADLAAMGDVYCNNAFGTAHRNDASMDAVPRAMAGRPCVAGDLLERELRFLGDVLAAPEHPFAAVLGGAKVADKIAAIRNLLGRVDDVLVGGAMAYTYLAAKGIDVGASRMEVEMVGEAAAILEEAAGASTTIHLPTDHVIAQELRAGCPIKTVSGAIPPEWMGLDIGPETAVAYEEVIQQAKTIVWNGPMGVFEIPPFDTGSRSIAAAIVAATGNGATTIVGGGDTAAAIETFGLAGGVSHVSTGGGASLQMLQGATFDSVAVLNDV